MAGHNYISLGMVFHRLTVVEFCGTTKGGHSRLWKCVCECGKFKVVRAGCLRSGHTKSCGCIKDEKFIIRNTTHGLTKAPEYHIWQAMISRCYHKKNIGFKNYGGRGITVCERWRKSFAAFFEDMGPRPSAKHSIDRFPDNDGNYEPGNCRWATIDQQVTNKRTTVLLTFNGETLHMAEWSRKTGLLVPAIRYRLAIGWPIDKVLGLPVQSRKQRKSKAIQMLKLHN